MDLFSYAEHDTDPRRSPLADRLRPESLADYEGQDTAVGDGSLIRNAIEADHPFSMILWGPPGCGKTTLAKIMAKETASHFVEISAVLSGVGDIRNVIDAARKQRRLHQRQTLLFVDEIHRFNKAQQDAFLHHVESGLITLIGATTENPSFEVIPALLSRCRVIQLVAPDAAAMNRILDRALADEHKGLGALRLSVSTEARMHLIHQADGDVRMLLNNLEAAAFMALKKRPPGADGAREIALDLVEQTLQKKALHYDKSGEEHYNLISAFHKSLRGSDPDGALYWMERMLAGGEDPLYIARRMVRFASEDVGNADPHALTMALNAVEAFRLLGHPEGELALSQAVVYLATAPKSNAVYAATQSVRQFVASTGYLPVPLHIRNAPTGLMQDMGYGEGYRYAHDYEGGYAPQDYLPDGHETKRFYFPVDRGYEQAIGRRLSQWLECRRRSRKAAGRS
ncbi:MAG: AAA family ATPase [Deltaproteobacteria bacterium]|nr:MAG: AAA family ATPase [Deltaproteobacteria bacterium]